MFGAPFRRQYPRSTCPRWIVPHVLSVPALQIRNPITVLVLMESNNPSLHDRFFLLMTDN